MEVNWGKECVMNIKIAEEKDFDDVKKITRETIMEIYPMYYPHGAVLFFAEHHSDENIMRDRCDCSSCITSRKVYLS